MLISIIYRSLYCCMLTGIHRSMERVTSDFRRSCLDSSSSVFIVAINTCNTLQTVSDLLGGIYLIVATEDSTKKVTTFMLSETGFANSLWACRHGQRRQGNPYYACIDVSLTAVYGGECWFHRCVEPVCPQSTYMGVCMCCVCVVCVRACVCVSVGECVYVSVCM